MLDGLAEYHVVARHQVRLRRTRTKLDHLLIAPSGVYVVATEAWTDRVELRDTGSACSDRSHDCSSATGTAPAAPMRS